MNHKDEILALQKEIAEIEQKLTDKRERLKQLQIRTRICDNYSNPEEKIRLFCTLFRGRKDVYALRFESSKKGRSGYQPACANEWRDSICNKKKVKCARCNHRKFLPLNEEVICNHLIGEIPPSRKGGFSKLCVVGIYPMLQDETCWFLAVDFDKEHWQQDVRVFMDICKEEKIYAYLERSRSGNGGHVWIFFKQPVSARIARELGSVLITKTMDQRPELGLDSFDRFFPNQDRLTKGGFGNLIALPLQKQARVNNNSVFINEQFQPYEDQWLFLSCVKKLDRNFVESYVEKAYINKTIFPVSQDVELKDFGGKLSCLHNSKQYLPIIDVSLPKCLNVELSNQIYIPTADLPPILRNRILRLASFSNPEFYKAQVMRLPTWNKPRILYCYEMFSDHIALPVGCLNDLCILLDNYKIKLNLEDKRNPGCELILKFKGILYPEQEQAASALVEHETGILSATTAFGKTVVGLSLIAERKVNTLILVHRKQLMNQWVESMMQFFGISDKEIGRYGGGYKKRNGKLDVAILQSVNYKGKIPDWISDYGQIIVDECHHISAFSFEQVIRKSNALYKMGLSATLKRKDGQHPIVYMNLGPVRYHVSARKQAAERNFEHWIQKHDTDFTIEKSQLANIRIQDIFRELWQNPKRNNQIVKDICDAFSEGRQILVLSERTEHLEILRIALREMCRYLFVLKGGLGKKQLKKIFMDINAVPDGESLVILATGRYLGEGFDLPFLDTLFMCFPVSWKGTVAQYVGRLHREYHKKTEVIVHDYVDINVPALQRMYKKRLKGYRSLGYKIVE